MSEVSPLTPSNVASRQAPVIADQNALDELHQQAGNSVEESKRVSVNQSTFMESVPKGPVQPALEALVENPNVEESTAQQAEANLNPTRDEPLPTELQGLLDVLKNEYKDETLFNKALFKALRTCLQTEGLAEPHHAVPITVSCTKHEPKKKNMKPEYIVFKYGQTETHAIGIAREITGAHQQPDNSGGRSRSAADVEKDNANGLLAKTRIDHCSCLLQRDKKSNWKFTDCFSDVELKMADAKCCVMGCCFNNRARHPPLSIAGGVNDGGRFA